MKDAGKGFEAKTKRELVEILLADVCQWAGTGPLSLGRQARANAVLALLGDYRLWMAEIHWLALCHLWLSRSSHPDAWLRDFWLGTVQQWQRFLAEDGFGPDSRPFPPSALWRPRKEGLGSGLTFKHQGGH